VEEKGMACGHHGHRRNHTTTPDRQAPVASIAPIAKTAKAS